LNVADDSVVADEAMAPETSYHADLRSAALPLTTYRFDADSGLRMLTRGAFDMSPDWARG